MGERKGQQSNAQKTPETFPGAIVFIALGLDLEKPSIYFHHLGLPPKKQSFRNSLRWCSAFSSAFPDVAMSCLFPNFLICTHQSGNEENSSSSSRKLSLYKSMSWLKPQYMSIELAEMWPVLHVRCIGQRLRGCVGSKRVLRLSP
jgi:hypothetical protein